MTLPDTLLVNGVDLQSLPLTVEDFSGLHAPGTRRGPNPVYPGVRGQKYVPKVYDAYTFDVPATIWPDNSDGSVPVTELGRRARFVDNLRLVAELLDDGLLALTRKLAAVGGGTIDHTASGEYAAGLAVTLLNPETGRTVLSIVNLDGCWLDGAGGLHL